MTIKLTSDIVAVDAVLSGKLVWQLGKKYSSRLQEDDSEAKELANSEFFQFISQKNMQVSVIVMVVSQR